MTPGPGIERGPQRWEASTLTTAPSLHTQHPAVLYLEPANCMERILSIVVINMRIFTAIFHKADYIFFLFTQLVNESCTLHTAMVFMA